MDRIDDIQRYIPVDTAAGIPTAGRNVVHGFHRDHIFRCAVAGDVIGNVKGKSGISVMMFSDLSAVDKNISVGIYPVKIQNDPTAFHICRQYKALSIPSGTTGKKAALGLAGCGIALCDTEIMGKRNLLP